MKKITYLFVLLATSASAQITYEFADYATAGEIFSVQTASGFAGMNFAASGENQNWNFSGMSSGDTAEETSWLDPNDAGYKLSWCFTNGYFFNCSSQFNDNFNLAAPISDGMQLQDYGISNLVSHSRANDSGLEARMIGLTANISGIDLPMAVEYQSPDVVYHFPITYNDSYVTNGLFDLDMTNLGLPFHYTSEIQRTNNVQGWGSLTTPARTFPDVLKIKSVIERTDTVEYQGITLPIPTTTVSYQWFAKEFGMPVLQADGMELFGFFIPLTVKYLDVPALGVSHQEYNPNVALYPNPTSGMLQLAGDEINVKEVAVYNSLGALIAKRLDLSGQASGVYFIRITTDQGAFVRKAVKM
jgi:hypothetical protein